MHSHHSHSGDYVEHAKDHLDDIVQEAIRRQFKVFCLTEHMPRLDYDHLYPEEIELNETVESLENTFEKYYHHARRLQKEYQDKIHLLVGMEAETIDERYFDYVSEIRGKYPLDMIVGSIHHTNTIPIDYSQDWWYKSRESVSSTGDEVKDTIQLFKQYFDDQYAMLQKLQPDVVGHFDLILLFTPDKLKHLISEPSIWEKIVRNISYAVQIGSLFEINSAAVRKGLGSPYPCTTILKQIKKEGGQVCLSDDSHGIAQVGLNFHVSAAYLQENGINTVSYLYKESPDSKVVKKTAPVSEVNEWVKIQSSM